MKYCAILAAVFACFVLLSGCGGGGNGAGNGSPAIIPTIVGLNGNFDFTAASQVTSNTAFIGGAVQTSSSGQITGTVHILDQSKCFAVATDVPLTGSINSNGQLTVTTASVGSQVITVSATSDGNTVSAGTYSVTGGCAAGDHGIVTGFKVQAFNGAYTGTVDGATVTALLNQSSTATTDGFFTLSGTASIT